MSVLSGWRGWRQFRRLSWDWRNIVFYSESGQDWHQFSGLIAALNDSHGAKVCYVTSDPRDPGLARRHPNFQPLLIPAGLFQTVFFQMIQADVMVLTMMDLGNLHLKRSVHPVHYVYLFHSMGSTHMVDHANSFDHYDTLFCAGPHQLAEIRKREAQQGLPAKQLFDYGHPRLEHVMAEGAAYRRQHAGRADTDAGRERVVLVAPTWGETSIFNTCGTELIGVLLDAGFQVIMRPHYHSNRLHPAIVARTRERFAAHPSFEYVDRMGETDSLLRSDLLVSDWSAIALEYALGLEKPVLFIDVPRRIRNPEWQSLGIEPVEASIRAQAGAILAPDVLATAPTVIRGLLRDPEGFTGRMHDLREQFVFRLGHSIPDGAAEIARIAARQRLVRTGGEAAHA